jgi:hypothetical protein
MKCVIALITLGFFAFISAATPKKKATDTQPASSAAAEVSSQTSSSGKHTRPVHSSTHTSSSAGSKRKFVTRTVVKRDKNGNLIRVRQAVRVGPPAPSYQLHPDPERYQQIQNALAARGYFTGQANGEWGDDSVDALKRFQADQQLPDDGKINALTLIGLGLGPQHGATTPSQDPVPTTPPAAVPALPAATPSVPTGSSASSPAPPATPPR